MLASHSSRLVRWNKWELGARRRRSRRSHSWPEAFSQIYSIGLAVYLRGCASISSNVFFHPKNETWKIDVNEYMLSSTSACYLLRCLQAWLFQCCYACETSVFVLFIFAIPGASPLLTNNHDGSYIALSLQYNADFLWEENTVRSLKSTAEAVQAKRAAKGKIIFGGRKITSNPKYHILDGKRKITSLWSWI
jgi:hypothetical protein